MEVSRRDRALAAAIDLLGTQGVRALTHARVDERAGLPRGSTSNYFRTRAALVEGVVEEMVARELPVVGPALAVSDEAELVEALVALFEVLTGPQRVVTAARLALYVEAGHDEVLGAALARGRARMAEAVTPAFAALGAPDPDFATLVVAALFEGMFLHVVARHARVDARRLVEGAVRMALAAPAPD
ncbi:TetR family transcriptional regulator C-terminal domain-containing protein [Phycicoccus sp.]|uniref:TetR/AcrR family transcriptional regulator n=1 Tax=Phycicoccus sp. TaxID=1902410 RepID=UPI002C5BBA3E|nr:TetR family transcriptional regulator C-terminal domain-containing protein [Phycicoccus sp.]HMM96203.1 TetR family transcriptional regulator C-terminal domain-containing protein [Phycicoccus sp.]